VGELLSSGDVRSAEQVDQWYQALGAKAHVSTMRANFPWALPLSFFTLVVLAVAGYPTWRILALGATFAAPAGWIMFWLSESRRARMGAAAWDMIRIGPRFPLMFLSLAFSGGIRSPFLPFMLIPFSDLVVAIGWSRMMKATAALVAIGLLAMGLLPEHWFGPQVPHPAYGIILLSTLATTAAIQTRYLLILGRKIIDSTSELNRARGAMVERAVARARDMEQLATSLSQQLKNPLTAIKGLVQLSARAATDTDSREQLYVVAAEVDRMEGILKESRSFSRPMEALQLQRIALGALADEVLAAMEARAASAGVVTRRRGDALVEADPRRLKEALFNLVGNALDATSERGIVVVEIQEADQQARIAVRDSGRGMPPEVLERLGTPFFTTRDEGTGLGVVGALAVFALHGGSLVYASEPGRGTTAVGTLPLTSSHRTSDVARAIG
jgi:signal transduction histidine kinase